MPGEHREQVKTIESPQVSQVGQGPKVPSRSIEVVDGQHIAKTGSFVGIQMFHVGCSATV